MAIIVQRPKRELAPEGIFSGQVVNVELINHEEYGARILFSFDLEDQFQEDGTLMRVFRSCNYKLTPKSALTGVVEDILGRPLVDGEAYDGFDLECLIGKPVQLVVKHKVSAAGNTYAVVDTIIHLDEPVSTEVSPPVPTKVSPPVPTEVSPPVQDDDLPF